MNSKILFSIIFILGLTAVIFYGYTKATPPAISDENAPKIEISPASYDFGQVDFGKIIDYTFKIKNSGQSPLEIKRIATSCGCKTAKASKTSLLPGEETDLLVTYDTAAMGSGPHGMGSQERIIYVKTNDPNTPQVSVSMTAYVK